MKNVTRRGWTLLLGLGLAGVACESSPAGSSPDDNRTAGDTGSAGDSTEGSGTAGSSAGSAGDSSSLGEAGSAGATGNQGEAGAAPIGGDASPLPAGTLLYIRHQAKDQDLLVALDLSSGVRLVPPTNAPSRLKRR